LTEERKLIILRQTRSSRNVQPKPGKEFSKAEESGEKVISRLTAEIKMWVRKGAEKAAKLRIDTEEKLS
jgi:hypothetical protein